MTTCRFSVEHCRTACPSPILRVPGWGRRRKAGKQAHELYGQIWKEFSSIPNFWLSPMTTSSFTAKVCRSPMFDSIIMDSWNRIKSHPKRQQSLAFGICSGHNVGNKSSARMSMWVRASLWIALKVVLGAGWNTKERVRFENWMWQCCLCTGQPADWQRLSCKYHIVLVDILIRWESFVLTQYIATRHWPQRWRPGFIVWQKWHLCFSSMLGLGRWSEYLEVHLYKDLSTPFVSSIRMSVLVMYFGTQMSHSPTHDHSKTATEIRVESGIGI